MFCCLIYEPLTDYKNLLSDEITKKVKQANLFSHFGGKYKTIIDIDPINNFINIDVKTIDNKWRLMKMNFYIN